MLVRPLSQSMKGTTRARLFLAKYNIHPISFMFCTGAVNGSGDFRNPDGLLPLRRTRSCVGNELNLSQCPQVVFDNMEATCERSENAYIVCQGMF